MENPSCAEIKDVLTAAGMNVRVEVLLCALTFRVPYFCFKSLSFCKGLKFLLFISLSLTRTSCIQGNGIEMSSSEDGCEFKSKKRMGICVKTNLRLVSVNVPFGSIQHSVLL